MWMRIMMMWLCGFLARRRRDAVVDWEKIASSIEQRFDRHPPLLLSFLKQAFYGCHNGHCSVYSVTGRTTSFSMYYFYHERKIPLQR